MKGVVNVKKNDCAFVRVTNNIVYCLMCDRVSGYLDKNDFIHLHNVRPLRFEPAGVRMFGNEKVQIVNILNDPCNKRKYPVDELDFLDEPFAKKQKFESTLLIRIEINGSNSHINYDTDEANENINENDELSDESEWDNADFITSTPGRSFSPMTPSRQYYFNHDLQRYVGLSSPLEQNESITNFETPRRLVPSNHAVRRLDYFYALELAPYSPISISDHSSLYDSMNEVATCHASEIISIPDASMSSDSYTLISDWSEDDEVFIGNVFRPQVLLNTFSNTLASITDQQHNSNWYAAFNPPLFGKQCNIQ